MVEVVAHGKFKFCFWKFPEFFFNICNLSLVGIINVEPADPKGQLYSVYTMETKKEKNKPRTNWHWQTAECSSDYSSMLIILTGRIMQRFD